MAQIYLQRVASTTRARLWSTGVLVVLMAKDRDDDDDDACNLRQGYTVTAHMSLPRKPSLALT